MERRRWRVFLDTSALIAGIVSATGAAREVLRLCEAGVVDLMISRQVLVEADRNISEKLPAFVSDFRDWMNRMSPLLVEEPSKKEVVDAAQIIHAKDAPILAAAMNAEADYLISWNNRHFHKPSVIKAVRFKIVTPGEFLQDFRQSLHDS